MHVQSIHLKYFKRFRDEPLDFTDPETGSARNLVVLVGENGSGKSTVLQAIAATLGTATRRFESPSDLEWPGFDLSLAGKAWSTPYEVAVEVGFSDAETSTTVEYFSKIPGLSEGGDIISPSQDRVARLTLRDGRVQAATTAQYFQFRGREYAKQVLKTMEHGYDVFNDVGSVFWYTENRTATSLTAEGDNGDRLEFDERLLRRRLADFMQFHSRIERNEYKLRPGQRDLFAELKQAYLQVFPKRGFEGAVPRSGVDDILEEPWFFLWDGTRQYEVSEMSGGERAIFPLLFDFVNWKINNSVILIDELELHLHPPLQQHLVRALTQLGSNNQFIIATHSNWVSDAVPPECLYRLGDDT
jgi:predicted ATPase